MKKLLFILSFLVLSSLITLTGFSQACIQPDNGTGTATMPPEGCDYLSPDDVWRIIDGLPAGSTIECDGPLTNMFCCPDGCLLCSGAIPPGQCETPGGNLGGTISCFMATLVFQMDGTGQMADFNRYISIPVFCEVHTGPRNPGDPVQEFPTEMFRLQGEIFGDPDFCTLKITGGSDNGLPSPGHTTLTQLPTGNFNVDSFFDITYQIEFEGCPGSQLEGFAGTTTATIRMQTGETVEQGDPIFVGDDLYTSPCGTMGFGDNGDYPPIPADFFGPGSDPFDGIIALEGGPSGGSQSPDTDVLVRRMTEVAPAPPPSTSTVDIEIVALSLKSTAPITVTWASGAPDSFFDVFVDLDLENPSNGLSDITQADDFGGEFSYFDTKLYPTFTFVDQVTGDSFVFSPGNEGFGPINYASVAANLWTRSPIPGDLDVVSDERVILQSDAGTSLELLPLPKRFEDFSVTVDENGLVEDASGTGWNDNSWYIYPNFEWTNIWFYDHPVDQNRRKIINGNMLVEPRNPGQFSYVEIVWNYSTPDWPGWPEVDQPPLPEDVIDPITEELMIVRTEPLFTPYQGFIFEPIPIEVPHEIQDFNPEWLSIDIRGYNYVLSGNFEHTCWKEGDCDQGEDIDWGDAPDGPYPTLLASVGASHIIDPDVFMGDFIDGEGDGQPTVDAMGDDNNPAIGPDDEDGVEFMWPISAGNPCKVKVKASVSDAYLNAWVDFDGNGDWDGADEQIFDDEPLLVVGDNILNFKVPKGAVPGATYARFRFSHQLGISYRGQAYDGEVEDYIVEVDEYGNIKWRQLPDPNLPGLHATYTSVVADDWLCNGGAVTDIHWWGNYENNYSGSGIDHFHLSLHNDNGECLPVDPEFMGFDVPFSSIQEVNTGMTNSDGSIIYYYEFFLPEPFYQIEGRRYWLDITAVSADPDYQWRWQEAGRWFSPILCGAVDRLGQNPWQTIFWPNPEPGRFSDMAFIITSDYTPSDELDFGDAPDTPYPTLLGSNGARHIIDPTIYMGNRIDAEPNGIPTFTALGDDNTNLDDEDGVTFVDPFVVGDVATVKVVVSVDGYLNAWLDYNKDGSWGAAENIIPNQPVTAGLNTFSFNIPAGVEPGRNFARFRYNTTGGLLPTGQAQDGEVEDYRLVIYPPNWGFTPTGRSHLISVPVNMLLNCVPLVQGDFVSVWFTDQTSTLSCGGAAFWDGTNNQVVFAFGDDQTTPVVKEGFDENEDFLWKVYYTGSASEQVVEVGYDLTMPNFDGKFHDNGLSALTWMTDPVDVTATAVPMTVCEGDPVQLGASVSGGCGIINFAWASNPVGFISNIQNPIDTPSETTTYIVSADDGYSSDTDQVTVTVIPIPDIICPDDQEYCISDPAILLIGATPAGGTYAGPGVIGGVFYPATAGVGTHTIVYTYVVPGTNCSDFCTFIITVHQLPNMDCPGDMYACDGDPDVKLTGGYPLGGVYSGTSVSFDGTDYWFDPDIGPGTYEIRYCFVDPVTNCSNCCYFDFHVRPLPEPECPDNDVVLCENDDPLILAGLASPLGGDYIYNGNVITTFDPAAEGPGEYIIEYCWTNPQTMCTGCCSFKIIVIDIPTLTCPENMEVCVDDDPFTLSGASPAGGVYSGPGVAAGMFSPSAAGVGIHTIKYTYTMSFGNFSCSDFCTFIIKVNPLPNVDCPPFMEACYNDPRVKLDLAAPAGGDYNGPGVYFEAGAYWFNPSIGVGTHLIYYCWTDPNTGCTGCCEFNFYVNPPPEVDCPANMLVCENDDPFDLTGATPVGGTYSGPGVTANKFHPGVAGPGTHTIEYCWIDPQTNCEGCCTFEIEVIDIPEVFCPDDIYSCYDDPPFTLSGAMPSGGTYAGPGVLGGVFYPATAGAGTHTIVYTYVVPGTNCNDFCTYNIIVYPLPVMDCPPDQYACDGDPDVKLTGGYPLGGEYSGTGVSFDGTDYWFDPDIGPGTYIILYCFIDPVTHCSNCCEFNFIVKALPVVECPPDMVVCLDTDPFDLTGATPPGGTYTGPGVTAGKFDPAAAGAGEHTIEYCYTDPQTQCENCCTFKITVIDLPQIVCPDDLAVCLNDDPFILTGGTPPGGSYSGNGVSLIGGNYIFNPLAAGVGQHIITYTIGVPGTNCFAQCEFKITVKPLPVMDCPGEMGACLDSGLEPLDNAYPLGGTYTGDGVVFNGGAYFFDTSIGVGNYLITYCYTDPNTGCSNCCEFIFVVKTLPEVDCGDDITVCITTDPFDLTQAIPSGGVYSGNGVSGIVFDPEVAGAGEHIITYEYTDPLTLCTNTCTFKITVIEVIATCPENMVVCLNDPPFELTGASPGGGYYSGPGVSGDDFNPATAGVGTHTILYCVADPLFPNCVGCCEFAITVEPLPVLDCPAHFDVCLNSAPVELVAYPLGGTFSGFGVYADGAKWYFDPAVGIGLHTIEYCYTDPDTGCTDCCLFIITVVVDQLIEVNPGWQGISSYVIPNNPDITDVMYPLGDGLIMLYEYPDKFYYPSQGVNTIGNWDTYKGYILKTDQDHDLPMCGPEAYPKTLALDIGWQVIPVLSSFQVSVEDLFFNVGGLVIVKDVAGEHVYWKEYGINTIGELKPGISYFVKMIDQGVIEFPSQVDNTSTGKYIETDPVISPWNTVTHTPSSHTVAFNLATSEFVQGDIIGGFTSSGICAGLIEVVETDQPFALSLNANDTYTTGTDGYELDEYLSYKVYRPSTGETFELEATYNPDMNQGFFEFNGMSEVTSVKMSATGFGEQALNNIRIFPNPSHGIFNIEGIDETVDVRIYNAFGEEVISNEVNLPQKLDLSNQPNGVYFIRIFTKDGVHFEKLVIN